MIFFEKFFDFILTFLSAWYINITIHSFPDCVMVAPQILVLIVGVRILLGELTKPTVKPAFF